MGLDTNVAVVALLVSLVALIISVAQLLQQIFGAAEGYRQCNPSIIGPWSSTRRRVFHLRELRLETVFETPEFTMTSNIASSAPPNVEDQKPDPQQKKPFFRETKQEGVTVVDGTPTSRHLTYTSTQRKNDAPNSENSSAQSLAVGWLSFLQKIHDHEALYRSLQPPSAPPLATHPGGPQQELRLPAIRRVKRSWDFLPSDALRPLASAQLGDLLILSYRMLIGWYDLRLGRRSLRAEGHGHSFTQIEIRGLGIVLEYHFAASGVSTRADRPFGGHFVPSKEADMMAFGYIPISKGMGMAALSHDYFDLGKEDYNLCLLNMLTDLQVGQALLEEFSSQIQKPPSVFFDVSNEALPLVAPFIPVAGLGAVKVIHPFKPKQFLSLFYWREGRLVLLRRLQSQIQKKPDKVSPQMKKVHDILHTLHTVRSWNGRFGRPRGYGYDPVLGVNAQTDDKRELVEYLRDEFNNANRFLQESIPYGSYTDLVALHLAMGFRAQQKAKATVEDKRRVGIDESGVTNWKTESAHLYVDNLEQLCQDMQKRCASPSFTPDPAAGSPEIPSVSTIADAWWSMMLRAILWQLSVVMVELPGLPYRSNLYGDTTMVWIA